MKLFSRNILVLLITFSMISFSVGQNASAGIEFHGQIFQSFGAVRQAAANVSGSVSSDGAPGASAGIRVEDIGLYCGIRLTTAVLARGYYDGSSDPVVCFTSESESDQLYADNRSIETGYKYLIWGFAAFVLMACLIAVRYITIRIGVKKTHSNRL